MYVISVGNPFNGIVLYGNENSMPWENEEDAIETAECKFRDEDWHIVKVSSISEVHY